MDRRSFLGAGLGLVAGPALAQAPAVSGRTCYTMSFAGLDKGEIKLADFAGKPIMVVNTASLCGFVGQYAGLQKLWERFSPMGLMMIAVPSNDFGGQEPGGSDEIHHATEGYGVRFPIAAKAKVLAQRLECGTAWVNKHGGIQPNAPFGGVKQSGIGVEFSEEGLKEYTTVQTVYC